MQSALVPFSETFEPRARRRSGRRALRAGLSGGWDVTRKDRLARTRNLAGGSGDDVTDHMSLWDMREISRDLWRNNELYRGLVGQLVRNLIGKPWQLVADPRAVEYWTNWAKNDADRSGRQTFWQLIRTVRRAKIVDGDHFLIFDDVGRNGRGSLISAEADRCVTPKGAGEHVVNGIDADFWGEPRRYFFANRIRSRWRRDVSPFGHVAESDGRWVSAENVLHVCDFDRTSASRGTPIGATIARALDDLDALLVSTRIAARMTANSANVVIREDADEFGDAQADGETDDAGFPIQENEPGEWLYLRPGEDYKSVGSQHPSPQLEPFLIFLARLVGIPFGLPVEFVLMFFMRNLSASRMGFQLAKKAFEEEQLDLTGDLTTIFLWAVGLAMSNGDLPADPRLLEHEWIALGWPFEQPVDDARADKINLENRTTSRTRIAARSGEKWETIQEELEREDERIQRRGTEQAEMPEEVAA